MRIVTALCPECCTQCCVAVCIVLYMLCCICHLAVFYCTYCGVHCLVLDLQFCVVALLCCASFFVLSCTYIASHVFKSVYIIMLSFLCCVQCVAVDDRGGVCYVLFWRVLCWTCRVVVLNLICLTECFALFWSWCYTDRSVICWTCCVMWNLVCSDGCALLCWMCNIVLNVPCYDERVV